MFFQTTPWTATILAIELAFNFIHTQKTYFLWVSSSTITHRVINESIFTEEVWCGLMLVHQNITSIEFCGRSDLLSGRHKKLSHLSSSRKKNWSHKSKNRNNKIQAPNIVISISCSSLQLSISIQYNFRMEIMINNNITWNEH